MLYLLYIAVGIFGGVIIGAIGSGSSWVILPFLTLIFSHLYPSDIAMKMAVATCLATLIVGTFSGAKAYMKSQDYDKNLIKLCFPSIAFASILSPLLSHFLSGTEIRLYVAVMLILISIYKLYHLTFIRKKINISTVVKNPLLIRIFSFLFTLCSGIAGVALGILMIPFLSKYADHKKVVGTNLMLAFPYAIIGTLSYFTLSQSQPHITLSHSVGYIYLPAFLCIAVMMAIFPPIGKRITDKISIRTTQFIFYIYLFIAGISMFFF